MRDCWEKELKLCFVVLACMVMFSFISGCGSRRLMSQEQAVKDFFKAVADQDDETAWNSLTRKSQDDIVNILAERMNTTAEQVRELIRKNPALMTGFWKKYREDVGAEELCNDAGFRLVKLESNEAAVRVTPKNGKMFGLKLYKENDSWKIGLTETFKDKKE